MHTNVKAILAMVLVLGGISSTANAKADPYFAQRQATAIKNYENLVRSGIADGSIATEECEFFIQTLERMTGNALVVATVIGNDTSSLEKNHQVKTLTVEDCK